MNNFFHKHKAYWHRYSCNRTCAGKELALLPRVECQHRLMVDSHPSPTKVIRCLCQAHLSVMPRWSVGHPMPPWARHHPPVHFCRTPLMDFLPVWFECSLRSGSSRCFIFFLFFFYYYDDCHSQIYVTNDTYHNMNCEVFCIFVELFLNFAIWKVKEFTRFAHISQMHAILLLS